MKTGLRFLCLIVTLMPLLGLTGCGRWYQALCLPHPETELLLRDIIAGAGDSALKQSTPAPQVSELRYSLNGRSYVADLYMPAGTAQAAVVFLPGTTTDGKQDPRMMAFANSLARSRFNVLVPELENLKALKITPADVDEIADHFSYLASRKDLSPGGRVGMAAVSYIVGPALLAAMQARIRDQVRFVVSIGGYYDLERVIAYITTGRYRDEQGVLRHREPNAHGKWVLVLSNSDRLSDVRDRQTLQDISRLKIQNPEAPITDLSDKLVSAEGKALFGLMTNQDPERVPALLAALPGSVRQDLQALTLSNKDFSQLKARVHLIHGYSDNLIPFTESLELERQIRSEHSLTLADGLGHVEFNSQPGWFDAWSLACVTNRLLDERYRLN